MDNLLVDVEGREGWVESGVRDVKGGGRSYSLLIASGDGVKVSLWRAEPGHYDSDGIAATERFMVRSGVAIVKLRGESFRLTAGSVFTLPAQVQFGFEVTEEFCKFAVSGI